MTGILDLGRLKELVEAGEIDTVVVAFPDMQGRLMGKRVAAHGSGCWDAGRSGYRVLNKRKAEATGHATKTGHSTGRALAGRNRRP